MKCVKYIALQSLKRVFSLNTYDFILKSMHLIFFKINIERSLYICCDYEQMELRHWRGMKEEKDG